MRLSKTLFVFAITAALLPCRAQSGDAALPKSSVMPVTAETRAVLTRLLGDTLVNGQAYDYDRQLADGIGPRVTGTANYLAAVRWAEEKFQALGLDNVHTETFRSDVWEPLPGATGRITAPIDHVLHLWSYGLSPSTPKGGVTGEVTYLPTLAPDAQRAMRDRIQGHIVLLDRDSTPKKFGLKEYGESMATLDALRPVAVLTAGTGNGAEDMGMLSSDGTLSPYPVAQIGLEDALLLRRTAANGTVRVSFEFTNRTEKQKEVPQVIADIRGSEKPDEVVLLGAHLDSWNPGTGAQDDGTGVAMVLEAARAIRALPRAPRRTVRFALFGGEEQGLFGSAAYVNARQTELNMLDAVLISDTGAEMAKGWQVMGRSDEVNALKDLRPVLAGLGADGVSEDPRFLLYTDVAPFDVQGVPTLLLWTGNEKYHLLHHKASDTFDAVNRQTLTQGSAVFTVTAYAIADSTVSLAPHIGKAQVRQMLKDVDFLNDYDYLKSSHQLP